MKKKSNSQHKTLMFIAGFLAAAVLSGAVLYYDINYHQSPQYTHSNLNAQSNQNSIQSPAQPVHVAQMQASVTLPGDKTVPVLAVDNAETTGLVGHLTVREIPGDSKVLVNINPLLQTDLQYSVNQAVAEAKSYSDYQGTDDLLFSYNISSDLLGGGSAGAATTIAAIATLEGKSIDPTIAITGTIDDQGNIGPVGGLLEKEQAAAAAGYKTLLIPKGQAIIMEYNRTFRRVPTDLGISVTRIRYVPKSVDLVAQGKLLGITVIEVATIDDAVKMMIN